MPKSAHHSFRACIIKLQTVPTNKKVEQSDAFVSARDSLTFMGKAGSLAFTYFFVSEVILGRNGTQHKVFQHNGT
jgi:hypothetical protein